VRSTGNAILAPMRRQLDVGSVLTRVFQTSGNGAAPW
jgi:hypothetical protein